ncbi:cysteine desulfurase [Klebsiella pneumoniae]|uniref:Cysteine desulfurase n=1 Tax=Klebsiella pneumoniae TaxID=573 RepID=A0A377XMW3_KLEPN|nr:cysteine desulfurase [Klebsiella pneumoniae]
MEEVYLNGDLEQGAPNILNVSFNYVEGESLIMALKDLAVFLRFSLYFREP